MATMVSRAHTHPFGWMWTPKRWRRWQYTHLFVTSWPGSVHLWSQNDFKIVDSACRSTRSSHRIHGFGIILVSKMNEFWSGGDEYLGISFFYPKKVGETIASQLRSAEVAKLDFNFCRNQQLLAKYQVLLREWQRPPLNLTTKIHFSRVVEGVWRFPWSWTNSFPPLADP